MVQAFDVNIWSALQAGIDMLELADVIDPPTWHRDALCLERPANFFPLRGESAEPARDVCRECIVRRECAAWALDAGADLHGVWGGLSGVQRKRARKAGLSVDDVLEALDERSSTWQTAPCRGCGGLLSRNDVDRGDGLCWACWPG